ncbi:hypothetical protein [Duganella aceris]|uniref:Uncharacterized protein n=1 Tax=Duganella aceris TaxID=2703883 RepID=A0ABX0FGV1_9BURK|nr:hypothetical protein [Duganella aceris]NGZ83722.1 hypothetical protein [Duganella aceris]
MCTDLPFAFPIRVPDTLLVEMGKFTGLHWNDSFGMEPYVCEALRNYMNPAPTPQEQAAAPSESGYQWKEVFLPEGTRLRASFDRKQYFAVVEGAEIKYDKYAISPSCFANLYGGGNRNAWKAVWLRLPGSTEWLLADVCRAARKAAIARLMEGDAKRVSQPLPAAPATPRAVPVVGKQPGKPAATRQGKRPPPRRASTGLPPDAALARANVPPAEGRSRLNPGKAAPSSAPGAADGGHAQRKKDSGRSARRKHRASKPIPGDAINPIS